MKYKKKLKKKRKRTERNKTNPQSKLKAYEKKCIEVFAFQNQKIIDVSS